MKFNKIIFKRSLIAILIIFIVLPLLYIGAVFGLSKIQLGSDNFNQNNKENNIEIYLKSNGVHADFIFPLKSKYKDWTKDFKIEKTVAKDSNSRYLQIGWGDKGFYFNVPSWDDVTFKDVFTASFALNESALHVIFLRSVRLNDKPGKECIKLNINEEQYKKLIAYVENTIERDAKNQSMCIDKISGYGSSDAFYEANGSYSLFHSCNTWINNGLKEASLPATLWTVTYEPIFECYE